MIVPRGTFQVQQSCNILGKFMTVEQFDIVVVGGGHAGVEAAWCASRFDQLQIALISMPEISLASAPCNPAIGGVGKGQLVREIDCMGGLMGILTDESAIQFRRLNETKGPAVQSTRAQIDKDLYSSKALEYLKLVSNLSLILDTLIEIEDEGGGGAFYRLHCESGRSYRTKIIIFASGTFLNGITHVGDDQRSGGRYDDRPSGGLVQILQNDGLKVKRFKTGTPARLDIKSLDFSKMLEQPSDVSANNFHYLYRNKGRFQPQVSCYLTRTNETTMGIIRKNRERSPLFNGQIHGVGPRYCPSIEDKAFRYPDRNAHHVFVEPEGLFTNSVYPNGLSTSLPRDVQLDFYRSIQGFENAEILRYGYAVEYDVVDTSELYQTLELKRFQNIFTAGQVNGTSGYEEAAGQGLVAGLNAALKILGKEPLIFSRFDSYLGVMIEDLVANSQDEPYRLFTARAENRLFVREDNASVRMAPYRNQMGLCEEIDLYLRKFLHEKKLIMSLGTDIVFNHKDQSLFEKFDLGPLQSDIKLADVIKRGHQDNVKMLSNILYELNLNLMDEVVEHCAVEMKYGGYIARSELENERIKKLSAVRISWEELSDNRNISFECRLRIKDVRPLTFGQLRQIQGIRPATLAYVAGRVHS